MADKYRDIIQKFGWNVQESGRALGVSRRQATRFAAGGELPAPVRKLLLVMVKHQIDPKEVEEF